MVKIGIGFKKISLGSLTLGCADAFFGNRDTGFQRLY